MYVFDSEVTVYTPIGEQSWALLNLIIVILGALSITAIALSAVLRQKKQINWSDYEECGASDILFKMLLMVLGLFTAVFGIIMFAVTQNTSAAMALADMWTIPHIIFVITGILCSRVAFRDKPLIRNSIHKTTYYLYKPNTQVTRR